MKKLAFSFLLCTVSAFATAVDYSTAGVFTSTGTNTVSEGGATITFAGSSASVNAPTFSSLGTFDTTATTSGTFSDTFTMTITQTVPSSGAGMSSTPVSGTITVNSSSISLVFSPGVVNIGDVTYTFDPDGYGLNNPQDNSGRTTIEAFIAAPTVPEPASLGFLGVSLLGLGIFTGRLAAKR